MWKIINFDFFFGVFFKYNNSFLAFSDGFFFVFSFCFCFFKLWSLRCLLLWCAGEKCKWILLCNLVKIIRSEYQHKELLVGGIFNQWRHWPSSNSRGSKVWRMFFFFFFFFHLLLLFLYCGTYFQGEINLEWNDWDVTSFVNWSDESFNIAKRKYFKIKH